MLAGCANKNKTGAKVLKARKRQPHRRQAQTQDYRRRGGCGVERQQVGSIPNLPKTAEIRHFQKPYTKSVYRRKRRCVTKRRFFRRLCPRELKRSISVTKSPAMIFATLRRCRCGCAVLFLAAGIGVGSDLGDQIAAVTIHLAGLSRTDNHRSAPNNPAGHSAPVGGTFTVAASGGTASTTYSVVPETVRGEDDLICVWNEPTCAATDGEHRLSLVAALIARSPPSEPSPEEPDQPKATLPYFTG